MQIGEPSHSLRTNGRGAVSVRVLRPYSETVIAGCAYRITVGGRSAAGDVAEDGWITIEDVDIPARGKLTLYPFGAGTRAYEWDLEFDDEASTCERYAARLMYNLGWTSEADPPTADVQAGVLRLQYHTRLPPTGAVDARVVGVLRRLTLI